MEPLPPSLTPSLLCSSSVLGGNYGNGKHPEIKQKEKRQPHGFPWTWGKRGKDHLGTAQARGVTKRFTIRRWNHQRQGEFQHPICWMKEVRLRSLEYKFKSLWEIMSWLKSWLLQGTGTSAGCSMGQDFSTAVFLTLGLIILHGGRLSCALWDGQRHPQPLPTRCQGHHHTIIIKKSLQTLPDVPWGTKLSLVENDWYRERGPRMGRLYPVTLQPKILAQSSQEVLGQN